MIIKQDLDLGNELQPLLQFRNIKESFLSFLFSSLIKQKEERCPDPLSNVAWWLCTVWVESISRWRDIIRGPLEEAALVTVGLCFFCPWGPVLPGLTQPGPYVGSAVPTIPWWPLWERWGASDSPLRVFMLRQIKKPQAFFQQLVALANWADSVTAGPLCFRPYVKLLSGTKGKC